MRDGVSGVSGGDCCGSGGGVDDRGRVTLGIVSLVFVVVYLVFSGKGITRRLVLFRLG